MDILFESLLIEPFQRFFQEIIRFLPRILSFVFILLIGIIVAYILKSLVYKAAQGLSLDRYAKKYGLAQIIKKERSFSVALSSLVFWVVVILFVFFALSSVNIPAIEQITEKFVLYLPNLFIAAFILFLGYLLGNVLGRAALIAAVNAGAKASGIIGKAVKLSIYLLAASMALEQLGIGKNTIMVAFAILFGGTVLALALAFGLGGKDIARQYLEKKIKGEKEGEKEDIDYL